METESKNVAAIIIDIVGSRTMENRAVAQDGITEAFQRSLKSIDPIMPVAATVGDEFQGLFASVNDALVVTARASLLLPEGVDVRCGIGEGEATTITTSDGMRLQDGTAWWNAREAIEEAHRRQDTGHRSARTWYVGQGPASYINSHLIIRDHIIFRMRNRERRLAAALLLGATQVEMADTEKISQSAVSQTLHRSGAIALRDSLKVIFDEEE